jgi:hypothetical protein
MDRREFLAGSLVAAVSPPITALATADVFRCFCQVITWVHSKSANGPRMDEWCAGYLSLFTLDGLVTRVPCDLQRDSQDAARTQNSVFGIRNLREPRELSQPNQLDMVGERGFEPPTPGPELGCPANFVVTQSFEWCFNRLILAQSRQFWPNVNPQLQP